MINYIGYSVALHRIFLDKAAKLSDISNAVNQAFSDYKETVRKIYIHYGSDTFKPELIHGPHNNPFRNKPQNAFWASPEDSDHGWKAWCEGEDFHTDRLDKSFRFKLKDGAKIFYVDSMEKERFLPRLKTDCGYINIKSYDFDFLKHQGYDAVEVSLTDCWQLYDGMYGWDCDSIAILNPDIVEVI